MSRHAPTLGETFNELRADYDMAKASRLRRRRTVPGGGSHADYHYRSESDYLKCMEYSRDVARNDVVASSMLEKVDTNTIQDGFTLDWQTGDKTLDADLASYWNAWAYDAEMCDLAGEHTFCDMESMSFVSSLVDGDIWGFGTDEGQLQWWEGHRVRTPKTEKNVIHGVLLDDFRRRLEVWVTKEDVGFNSRAMLVRDFAKYPIRDDDGIRRVFQVYTKTIKRFSQTRGVTAFAPMFDLFGLHDDTQFNAAVKQQVLNAILVFRKRGPDWEGAQTPPVGEQTTQQGSSTLSSELIQRVGPATLIDGAKGEDFEAFNSTAPGNEFFPHVKLILTLLGINLGLPLILVLMDASETNFSGWRGAFEQAKMGFKRNQQRLIRRLHDPVLAWKVAQWAKEDKTLGRSIERILALSRELKHTWHTPTWPYVDPEADRKADAYAVAHYQDSPSGVMAKNGLDYEKVIAKSIGDRGMAIRLAKAEAAAINGEQVVRFGFEDVKVSWRDLYVPPTPASLTGELRPTENQAAKPKAEPPPKTGGANVTKP